MADKANFEANLSGNFSKNAKKNAAAAGLFHDKMGKLGLRSRSMARSAAKAAAGINKVGRAQRKTNKYLMKGLLLMRSKAWSGVKGAFIGGAVGAAAGAAAISFMAAKRIEGTEATVFALERLNHRGVDTFSELTDMSVKLGLDVDKTAHSFANFLKLQFPEAQAKKLIALGADMQALGNSADDIQGIFRALGQIKSKGRVQAEEMLQLAERGVSQELVYTAIAKNRGLDDPGGQKSKVKIQALQQAGKISAGEFFVAFEQAINKKLGQTRAGSSAVDFVKNTFRGRKAQVGAQLTKFWIEVADGAKPGMQSAFGIVAKNLNTLFEDSDRMLQLKRIMGGIGTAFEVTGTALTEMMPHAIMAVDLFGVEFAESFRKTSGGAKVAHGSLSSIRELIELMIPAARVLGDVLGQIAGRLYYIGKALDSWDFGRIKDDLSFLAFGDEDKNAKARQVAESQKKEDDFWGQFETGTQSGAAFGDGVVQGIMSKNTEAAEAAAALGRSVEMGFKTEEEIHSPSRKATRLGRFWGKGLGIGVEESTPDNVSIVPGSGRIGAIGGGAGASSIVVGDTIINVAGSSDPEQTAQATLRAWERNFDAVLSRAAGEVAA